jgi:hypothetical protein
MRTLTLRSQSIELQRLIGNEDDAGLSIQSLPHSPERSAPTCERASCYPAVIPADEIMAHITRHYCLECEWSVSAEHHRREELAAQAVAHAVETGHDIDSEYAD